MAIFENPFPGKGSKRPLLTKAKGKSFDTYIKNKSNRKNKFGPAKVPFKETLRCTPNNRNNYNHNGHKFCKYTAA